VLDNLTYSSVGEVAAKARQYQCNSLSESWGPHMRERHWQFGYWNTLIVYSTNHLSWTWLGFWKICGRNSLWIKPTDALNSNFNGITTLLVSGGLSAHHQEFLNVHRHWYILRSFDDHCYQFDGRLIPGAGSSILFLVANCYETGSNDHQNCVECTNADVRLRTPDDERRGCPKHVES
jgi:hypothetical protein